MRAQEVASTLSAVSLSPPLFVSQQELPLSLLWLLSPHPAHHPHRTPPSQENVFPELTILSVANLLGETIWRVYNASSVQALREP